jgi:Uma2 family endonuclease
MQGTNQALSQSEVEIIATGVTFEEYLERFSGQHCELVGGNVIKMSPISLVHEMLVGFLETLLKAYFELRPLGRVVREFVMKVPNVEPSREPDLQIILDTNTGTLTATFMDGPADICIEVVSAGTADVDHGAKFVEYEKGGVQEYWIIDPIHKECRFYQLDSEGIFVRQSEDAAGNYRTPRLPGFVLHVPSLWQEKLPGPIATVRLVEKMLEN